ncbi:MAG: hypothetical protein LBB94_01035 [Clostridiales bacterium]|jgi:hypothetical protein|nr:hypothetical protein [Clostridiales bacterium]
MAVTAILGVSLVLRYSSGSFTYSYLKPASGSAELYEFGNALNSLQTEPFESVYMIVKERVAVE